MVSPLVSVLRRPLTDEFWCMPEWGLKPMPFLSEEIWCVLKTVGDITHGHMWVDADHLRDFEDVAGVEKGVT